jgi:hypothetical protein
MNEILVPVSVGELLDKITILRIKQKRIEDPLKQKSIQKELSALLLICQGAGLRLDSPTLAELEATNERLWDIEDDIRECERQKIFDEKFIELARAVYITNDRRFALKSTLNNTYGSSFREEKSYRDYT